MPVTVVGIRMASKFTLGISSSLAGTSLGCCADHVE